MLTQPTCGLLKNIQLNMVHNIRYENIGKDYYNYTQAFHLKQEYLYQFPPKLMIMAERKGEK